MDIINYIIPCRFDLMAKYLYIKYKHIQINSTFFIELYQNHIATFNNFNEYPGIKKGKDTFLKSFDALIDDIKKNGFNNSYPIPINQNNLISNGAHRLIVCFYYNIKPTFKNITEYNKIYNYKHFVHNGTRPNFPSLSLLYADRIALEYTKLNPNIRCMIIYPIAYDTEKNKQVFNIINKYGYIYYEKNIKLNNTGFNNLIKELYRDEEWIGGLFPPGWDPGKKTSRCIADKPTMLILIHMYDLTKCIELKEKCRNIYKIDKNSLHMSDYPHDTFRICSALLNDNSIHFLNNGTNDLSLQTKSLLEKYFNKIKDNNEDYCLTSSLILEMYNLRSAKDIDYLHKDNLRLQLDKIENHQDKWLTYYHKHKDEIIYNPQYHFYFNGFKFATIDVIKKMKENRNELKDLNDIQLINIKKL